MPHSEARSFDPCTGELIWSGPATGTAQLPDLLARARAGFVAWSETPPPGRQAVARRFTDLARSYRAGFARLISLETGKPLWESEAEVDSVIGKIEISIRAQAERAGESTTEMAGGRQTLSHRPHGVLAVLGPFNFPAHLPNGHIAPALLAGNAVVFKPSEKTPASGQYLVDLWRAAGLPDGVLQVVHGGAELGAALAAAVEVDGLLFTGSAATGRRLHALLADRPQKILALELGGNNPLIAWGIEDEAACAHIIVQSAYVSTGQRCSCARRLILPGGAEGDRILEAVVDLIDRIVVGAPFDEPQPFMGPVVDNHTADRLELASAALLHAGAVAIRPLARRDPARPFLQPALIDATAVAARADDEHFGPLLQVVRTPSFEAALAEAAATDFGLAAALLSPDEGLWRRFRSSVRAGVMNWNRPTVGASSAAPFGGVGASGNHRPGAYYAADYCAWPMAGLEGPTMDFRVGRGLAA